MNDTANATRLLAAYAVTAVHMAALSVAAVVFSAITAGTIVWCTLGVVVWLVTGLRGDLDLSAAPMIGLITGTASIYCGWRATRLGLAADELAEKGDS